MGGINISIYINKYVENTQSKHREEQSINVSLISQKRKETIECQQTQHS